MKIPPVSMTYRSSSEENSERRRERLLALLRELLTTSPELVKLNRTFIGHGTIDKKLCESMLISLQGKSDRRSLRVRRILANLLEL